MNICNAKRLAQSHAAIIILMYENLSRRIIFFIGALDECNTTALYRVVQKNGYPVLFWR